jgi:apolipoprotein N-acyltransferase
VGSAVLAGVSAVAFALGFPPTRWTLLSWIALAPLFVALRGGGTARALGLAWLWCVIGACAVGSWFPAAVAGYFHQGPLVALGLFVAVFSLMAGPYLMAFSLVYRALARRFGPVAIAFLAGAAWTAAELGRGRLLTGTPFFIGNPWALAGYAHAPHLELVQIASVTGIYGVSFCVACVNAAVAELWHAWGSPVRKRALAALGLAVLPAAASLAYGHRVLSGATPGDGARPIPVAIAQANLAVGAHWRSDLYGQNLAEYLELTREAARRGSPRLVFWPESAMTFFVEEEPAYREAIARVTRALDLELVAGSPRRSGSEAEPRYWNSVYVLDPEGGVRGRYDKEYLVPFAEYFPIGVDVLRRRFGRIRSFEHGTETGPLPTRAGPAGVLVCNEAMLPEAAADRVAHGATYLVNPSNDSWISDPQYTEQQFDIASLRAIEQRRYLVRVSTAGPSAVIDPFGRVQVRTRSLERDLALGELRPVAERSIYGTVGDLFGASCGLVVVAALALRRVRCRPDQARNDAGSRAATR